MTYQKKYIWIILGLWFTCACHGQLPKVYSSNYTTLNEACQQSKTVVIDDTVLCNSGTLRNAILDFSGGGIIEFAEDASVVIESELIIAQNQSIFTMQDDLKPADVILSNGMVSNIRHWGAEGSGAHKDSLLNWYAIRNAWNVAYARNVLYIPKGDYVTKGIGKGFEGFKQSGNPVFTLRGDGTRQSSLILAGNQNSRLLDLSMGCGWHDSSLEGISFYGGDNPNTDYLVYLCGYTNHIEDVYVKGSGGSGIYVGGWNGTYTSLQSEVNDQWGLVHGGFNNYFINPDIEANGIGNIKGIRTSGHTGAVFNGLYVESSPYSIYLEDVSNYVFNYSYHSSDDTIAFVNSKGNIIDNRGGEGNRYIHNYQGSSGNVIYDINLRPDREYYIDDDGIGNIVINQKLAEEVPIGTVSQYESYVENTSLAPGNKFLPGSIFPCSIATEHWGGSLPDGGHSGLTVGGIEINYDGVGYLYFLYDMPGEYLLYWYMRDKTNNLYYDYEAQEWRASGSNIFRPSGDGLEYLMIPILNDGAERDCTVQIRIYGKSNKQFHFYYMNLTTQKNAGLQHLIDGKIVGYGGLY